VEGLLIDRLVVLGNMQPVTQERQNGAVQFFLILIKALPFRRSRSKDERGILVVHIEVFLAIFKNLLYNL
jgi:hypothetical protein